MIKKIITSSLSTIIIIGFVFFIYFSFQNENDPNWQYVDSLVNNQAVYTIDEKVEFLDSVYRSIQKDTLLHKQSAIELINKPKLPIYEYRKFADAVSFFYDNRYTLLFGTISTGRSTISNMIAQIIAGDSSRILFLQCVPKLEVEYHKEYIGYNTENGFHKGKLLSFWEQCFADTLHNYVFLIDDVDKIQPATLFGASIWAKFKDREQVKAIEGYTEDLKIPDNFFLISVAAFGQNSELKFTEEHYSRISPKGVYNYFADEVMFYLLVRNKFDLTNEKDKIRLRNIVYFYVRANQYIENKYGKSFVVGQKSSIKNYLGEDQFQEFMESFVTQVNALEPNPLAKVEDFKDIVYSIENEGKLKNTHLFGKIYIYLVKELGILNELVLAVIFMLGSALVGLVYTKRRKQFGRLIQSANTAFEEFESGKITKEKLNFEITVLKKQFEILLQKGKIQQTEAIFFYNLIHDKLKYRTLTGDFFELLNSCLSDNVISEKEFEELSNTLEKIKSSIHEAHYELLKNKLHEIYSEKKVQ